MLTLYALRGFVVASHVLGAAVSLFDALLIAALVFGLLFHRMRLGGHVLAWALSVLIGLDVTCNAIAGGRAYSTISCRVGESMTSGGWAARVHWPAWWIVHCRQAIHSAIV